MESVGLKQPEYSKGGNLEWGVGSIVGEEKSQACKKGERAESLSIDSARTGDVLIKMKRYCT